MWHVSFKTNIIIHIADIYDLSFFLAIPPTTERPPSCTPSPCGPHSRCQLLASGPACSCLPGYVGSPPSCRPECTINSECPASLACVRQKCEDPCPGSCGVDASCHVLNHLAVCVCIEGYTGDPFARCFSIVEGKTIKKKTCILQCFSEQNYKLIFCFRFNYSRAFRSMQSVSMRRQCRMR